MPKSQKEITSTNPLFYASLVEAVRDLDLLDLGDASEVDIQRIVREWPARHPLLLILGLEPFLQQLEQLNGWYVKLAGELLGRPGHAWTTRQRRQALVVTVLLLLLLLLELAGLPLPALWQVACLATLGGDPLQDIVLEPEADLDLCDDLAVGEALSLAELRAKRLVG